MKPGDDDDLELPKRAEDPPPLPKDNDLGGLLILLLVGFMFLAGYGLQEFLKLVGLLPQ